MIPELKCSQRGLLRKVLFVLSGRVVIFLMVAISLLLLLFLYRNFDPSSSYLAPKCLFKFVTGLDCPGCGGQRALHAFLRGDISASFRSNPFLWLVLPYLIFLVISALLGEDFLPSLYRKLRSRFVVCIYLLLFFFWWVIRNTALWEDFLIYII